MASLVYNRLTHWGRVTHICVGKLTIIGSDNGLSPGRRQAIIRTNAGILVIGTLETNFSEIKRNSYIFIQENAFENVVWKLAAILSRPQCANQAEPWWRASIWRSHRKVVIKQCSYHNNIIDIQNRLPYSKVVYPAIIVLFSCLMEVNHGVRTGPDYPFR